MFYQEIVNKIESMRRFGEATGYQVSCEMLDRLLHPERGQKIIHIAGTNGKGSTAAILASILAALGLRVGLFTSPHLVRFNERIRILEPGENPGRSLDPKAGRPVTEREISDEDVLRLGEEILALPMDLSPTMFDICLGMGLSYYRDQACDVTILETGLGGRFDSTRACDVTPLICLITSIGLDHTAILGDSLEEIAANKAGILRPGTQCILGPMEEAASRVILRDCRRMQIPFRQLTREGAEQVFADYGLTREDLALEGDFQLGNGACAILAAKLLYEMGVIRGESAETGCFAEGLRRGLARVSWPGRMERICYRGRQFLIDGAHNPQGVDALAESIARLYPGGSCVFIIGVLADKDYRSMLEKILPLAGEVVAVTVENRRGLRGEDLVRLSRAQGIHARKADSVPEALDLALDICERREEKGQAAPLVLFGSLYFVGQVKEFVSHCP